MRAGDFSNTSVFPVIYDPKTNVNGQRTPFMNNRIPVSQLDPVALNIQNYFTTPNLPGVVNNWIGSQLAETPSTKYFGRLDYNISSNNR